MVSRISSLLISGAIGALFFFIILGYYVPCYNGTDENGYLLTAKRWALSGDASKHSSDPFEFVSGNWVQTAPDIYYAKYPIGYPALCALAFKIGGPGGVFWINPLLGVLTIVGIFLLGRALIGEMAGAFAAILMATNPLHAYFSISALSHTASVCFAVWGMFFVWRWCHRWKWWDALLSAFFTTAAVNIRYTEALLALPVIVLMGKGAFDQWRASGHEGKPRFRKMLLIHLAIMGATAFLTIAPLLLHHWKAYGAPWITGYALCGESTGFSWKWFSKNWPLMLSRMDALGLYLIFPIGLAGLCWAAVHDRRRGFFLALWALPSLLLYSAYYWAPEGDGPAYVRFFVSIIPAVILAAFLLLYRSVPVRRAWTVVLAVFVSIVAIANLNEADRRLENQAAGLRFNKTLAETIQYKVPEDGVILAEERILNFLEYAGEYRLYNLQYFEKGGMQKRTSVLDKSDPDPFQREKAEKLKKLIGDKNERQLVDMQRELIETRLKEGRKVFVVSPSDRMKKWNGRFEGRFKMISRGTISEIREGKKGEMRATLWALNEVTPKGQRSTSETFEGVGEEIDQAQARLEILRNQQNDKYPGLRESMTKIADAEKQLEELRRRQKKLTPGVVKPVEVKDKTKDGAVKSAEVLPSVAATEAITNSVPDVIATTVTNKTSEVEAPVSPKAEDVAGGTIPAASAPANPAVTNQVAPATTNSLVLPP